MVLAVAAPFILSFLFITEPEPSGGAVSIVSTSSGLVTNTDRPAGIVSTQIIPVSTQVPVISEEVWQHIRSTWSDGGDEGQLRYGGGGDYSLNYSRRFNQFNSTITNEPAALYRAKMEEELMAALQGMSPEMVCKLNIKVGRNTDKTAYEYQEIGLSFCPGSLSDEDLEKFDIGQ